MAITHPFVSAIPDSTDATIVKPSNWNAAHVGTVTGLAGLLTDDQHVLDAEVLAVAAAVAHKDTHDPEDGADKLDTAAPGAINQNASAAGSSHSLARADHNHQHTAALHQNGGGAEISLTGLDGEPSTLTTHKDLATGVHGAGANIIATTSQLPNRNAIINGAARVNQRVTAHTLVKDTYGICADRFYGMATGTAVSAGTLTTNTFNLNSVPSTFFFSAVTLTGTGVIYLRHRIEAKDSAQFKNQTASFRCYVRQDTGGAINYTVYIRKANAADNFAAVTEISNSGVVSIPTAVAEAGTALSYPAISMGDCSNGIEIEIKVECGAITTQNFMFSEHQLELGSVATPFEYRPYGTELALCQRYYEKSYLYADAPAAVTDNGCVYGFAVSTYELFQSIVTMQVAKRAVPTIVYYSTTGASGKIRNITDGADVTPSAASMLSEKTFRTSSNNVFVADSKALGYHWTATAEL